MIDLAISASDISFSGDLIAGDLVRLYAVVENLGDEDVEGYVSFFQGSLPLDDSQVISVRADGQPEEVYIDFLVPSGSFNIRAEIRGTDPQDERSDNDVAVTRLFDPVLDDDRDGIANEDDNCPSAKNEDQEDADADGKGDACDADDDNDGLSDDVEEELGSDQTKKDTDGDGVSDPDDAFPTDATRSEVLPPPAPSEPALEPAAPEEPSDTPQPEVAGEEDQQDMVLVQAEEETVSEEEIVDEGSAAAFRYVRKSWNAFSFELLAPETDGQRVEWSFGDGVTSNRRTVVHTYQRTGDFYVTLKVTSSDGSVSESDTVVTVPFFTLENRLIVGLLVLLGLLLLTGLALIARIAIAFRREKQGHA